MAQKRALPPAPIFNKSKRPRLSVLAHPGNTHSAPRQPRTKYRQPAPAPSYDSQENYLPRANSSYTYTHSHNQTWRADHSMPGCQGLLSSQQPQSSLTSYQPRPYYQERPSSTSQRATTDNYNHYSPSPRQYQQNCSTSQSRSSTSYQKRSHHQQPTFGYKGYSNHNTSVHGQPQQERLESTYQSSHRAPTNSSLPNKFTLFRKPPSPFHPSTSQNPPSTHSVGQTATGQAFEPRKSHSAQSGVSAIKESKEKPSLRLLTATAQGMRHWAKYKNHTPLLFEIFGKLVSPGVMTVDSQCKQFSIQSSDGPVSCQYWEVDRPLASLCVGGAYRVVGQWDDRMDVVKCFAVRSVKPGELECVKQYVATSDGAMRKLAMALNEN